MARCAKPRTRRASFDAAEILDAVIVTGELDLGAQVCFGQPGSIVLLDEAGGVPRLDELRSYRSANSTCAWIDRPGTVILKALPELTECAVTTTAILNFRRAPVRGEVISLIAERTWSCLSPPKRRTGTMCASVAKTAGSAATSCSRTTTAEAGLRLRRHGSRGQVSRGLYPGQQNDSR